MSKVIYSGKAIPVSLRKELQLSLGVSELQHVKGKAFTAILHRINKGVRDNYKESNEYSQFFKVHPESAVFTAKSLHRYFDGAPIRLDKLRALKCFLKHEPSSLSSENENGKKTHADLNADILSGAWHSYVYDFAEPTKNKVKRTNLFLKKKKNHFLDVQYEGLRGRFNGNAEILNNSILFQIESVDKHIQIYLCAELPVEGISKPGAGQITLNVYCLSNSLSGQAVMSNVIMVRPSDQKLIIGKSEDPAKFIATKPETLVYSLLRDAKEGDESYDQSRLECSIIQYLSRNKERNNRVLAFSPNNLNHIEKRNNESFKKNGRDNFDRLKMRLKDHVCYTFNRYRQRRSEVAVFSYSFEFIEEEKKCIAQRHPAGNSSKIDFEGEVILEAEKIYIMLKDENIQRYKQFIAPFNCSVNEKSNVLVFRGITSTVSPQTNNPMALRELMVCIPADKVLSNQFLTDEDKIHGYISYDSFCALPDDLLKKEEKLFLANQLHSTLTFPSKSDNSFLHYRQDKARKYKGCYYIFTFDTGNNNESLKMKLVIDSLAQVTLSMKYDNDPDAETFNYFGICEFYNSSLRIGVHFSSDYPNEERHSEFMFDPIIERKHKLPDVLTGINLTTDDENKALALRFIAVKSARLEQTMQENDTITQVGVSSYKELEIIESILKDEEMNATQLSNFINDTRKM